MPLISIIVPVYKVENVLNNCVQSILNQTFRDFELILVDDGSPDNSGKICDEYSNIDNRVRVIHKENGGVSSARNIGIQVAIGKFICFVDSDDEVDVNYLKLLIDLYENNVELAICGFNWFKNGDVINKSVFSNNDFDLLSRDYVMEIQSKVLVSSPWCKLYLSDIIKKNCIFFQNDLSLGEDLLFNFRYLNYVSNIAIVNQPLYHYMVDNGQSLLRKYRKDLFETNKKINNELFNIINKWNLPEEQMNYFYNKVYFDYENSMLNIISKSNDCSFFYKLKMNREIIKSKEFKMILNRVTIKLHPLYRMSYKIHGYFMIFIFNKIISLIRG